MMWSDRLKIYKLAVFYMADHAAAAGAEVAGGGNLLDPLQLLLRSGGVQFWRLYAKNTCGQSRRRARSTLQPLPSIHAHKYSLPHPALAGPDAA